MDQLKQALAQAAKYHFWWLAALAIIISLAGWYSAKNALSADYVKGIEKVKSQFGKVDRVQRTPAHPNEEWTSSVKGVTKKAKDLVYDAWDMVYGAQRSKVLHWPADLGQDFERTLQKLGPSDDIPRPMRERYRNYIRNEFVQLLKIVNARSFDEKAVPTGEEIVKLSWEKDSQKRIYESLDWQDTPESPQVRNAQENLWVYEALLAVIAKINEPSHDIHTSKIRIIDTLSIGREAGEEFKTGIGRDHVFHSNAAAAAVQNQPVPVPVVVPQQGLIGGGRLNEALSRSVTEEGRYVNEQGKPLEATGSPFEFKRMPVYMKLVMDQREISKLLVELANSPLPVEVRQVRLRPDKNAGIHLGDPANRVGQIRVKNDDNKNPFEMPIELHGIIYIFNPPEREKLGHPAESSEEAAAEGDKAAPAAAPATPAPAPTP